VPTYEYACTACGHRLEAVQSFSDEPLAECPECQGSLRKVYGAVGIVLKGSGFYKTDNRKSSGASKGGKKEAGESSSSSESKTESKTDSKAESKDSKPKDKKAESKSA